MQCLIGLPRLSGQLERLRVLADLKGGLGRPGSIELLVAVMPRPQGVHFEWPALCPREEGPGNVTGFPRGTCQAAATTKPKQRDSGENNIFGNRFLIERASLVTRSVNGACQRALKEEAHKKGLFYSERIRNTGEGRQRQNAGSGTCQIRGLCLRCWSLECSQMKGFKQGREISLAEPSDS